MSPLGWQILPLLHLYVQKKIPRHMMFAVKQEQVKTFSQLVKINTVGNVKETSETYYWCQSVVFVFSQAWTRSEKVSLYFLSLFIILKSKKKKKAYFLFLFGFFFAPFFKGVLRVRSRDTSASASWKVNLRHSDQKRQLSELTGPLLTTFFISIL